MSSELTIHFEGYWQCRQATDPDPSRDPRGASGYTFAIGEESDLDTIIRLQRDEIADADFRAAWPPPYYPPTHARAGEDGTEDRFGVFVSAVELDGRRYARGERALVGGKVRWLPSGKPKAGPRFELRNTITFNPGNNSGIFMPVDPFHILIEGEHEPVRIGRDDPLDPRRPKEKIWQISDSAVYRRRCPRDFYMDADEALQAIGLTPTIEGSPYLDYFQKRREWLELELSQVENAMAALETAGRERSARYAELEVRRGAYLNRLYVIEEFTSDEVGDRLGTRLGMLARWDHALVGDDVTIEGTDSLGGSILAGPDDEWRTGYWMGAFDGDTMRGYMRGHLRVPFKRSRKRPRARARKRRKSA